MNSPRESVIVWSGTKPASGRVLVSGLRQSGKTSFVYWAKNRQQIQPNPTTGYHLECVPVNDSLSLVLWDIGSGDGGDAVKEYIEVFADVLLYLLDSSDLSNLLLAKQTLLQLLARPAMSSIPLIIFASKQDMFGALNKDQIINAFQLQNMTGREWCVIEGSAKDGTGIPKAIEALTAAVLKRQLIRSRTAPVVDTAQPSEPTCVHVHSPATRQSVIHSLPSTTANQRVSIVEASMQKRRGEEPMELSEEEPSTSTPMAIANGPLSKRNGVANKEQLFIDSNENLTTPPGHKHNHQHIIYET